MPTFISVASNKSNAARYGCIDALGEIGDTSAVPALLVIARDHSDAARGNAARALGKIGTVESNQVLISRFANFRENWLLRRAAIRALNSKVTFDVFDINGDGLPDRILKGDSPYNYWYVQLNNRAGFNSPIKWQGVDSSNSSSFWKMVRYGKEGETRCDIFDINGDGKPDRVMKGDSPYDYWYVQLNNGEKFDARIKWTGVNSPADNPKWRAVRYLDEIQTYADVFDINGDSLPDRIMRGNSPYDYWYVQLNNGSGFDSMIQWQGVSSSVASLRWRSPRYVNNGRTHVDTFDINGDGLPDRVMYENTSGTSWKVQFNNGTGFEPVTEWQGVSSSIDGPQWRSIRSMDDKNVTYVDIFDINSDGLSDRILRGDSPYNCWYVQYNTGTGFEPLTRWDSIGSPEESIFYNSLQYSNGSNIAVMIFDINGDGLQDRVIQSDLSSDYWHVQLGGSDTIPDLLAAVDNGKGGQVAVDYEPSTKFANLDLPFPIYVVTLTKTIDSKPDGSEPEIYSREVSYEGGYYHHEDKEFRGFRKVTETDPITENYTETTFHQGVVTAEDCFKGRILDVKSFEGTGNAVNHIVNTWSRTTGGTAPNIINFVYLAETTATSYEGQNSLTTKASYEYDAVGNVKKQVEEGDTSKTGDEKKIYFDYTLPYADSKNRLILSQLKDKDDNVLRKTHYRYDSRGNLAEKEYVLDTGANPIISYTCDLYGNQISFKDANNNLTKTTYETGFYIFPYEVENAKGHKTRYQYDPKFGAVTSVTDPNGNTNTTLYDTLGRTAEERNADNELVTKYTYPNFNTRIEEQLTLKKETRTDGIGRAYMAISSGEDGVSRKDIISENFYNARGLLDKSSLPHYMNTAESQISYARNTYDIRGRIKKITQDFPGENKDYEVSTDPTP